MVLIPVIDIASGQVVHARGGNRADYPLLETTLCDSSHPEQVVAALLHLYPFTHLYIADLDAITGREAQTAVVRQLHARFPRLHLWVDSGLHTAADCRRWLQLCPATAVLGSETLADADVLTALPDTGRVVLSLDFRGERLIGPAELLQQTAHWPPELICMSLDHVGRNRGPDLTLIRRLRRDAGDRRLYAAGGVRDAADLQRLRDAGADGALLASALHNGRIGASQLNALC